MFDMVCQGKASPTHVHGVCGDTRLCDTKAVRSGVHPYHYCCLDLYGCLASACRVAGKRGRGARALRWAALAGLLHAGATESLLAAGEHSPSALASVCAECRRGQFAA